jgi:hypothetical protein
MKKWIGITIAVFILNQFIYSQKSIFDSIKNVALTSKYDTVQINAYCD